MTTTIWIRPRTSARSRLLLRCAMLVPLFSSYNFVLVHRVDSFTIQRHQQQRHQQQRHRHPHRQGSGPVRTTPTTVSNPQPRRRNPRAAVAFGSPNADDNNNSGNNNSSDSPAKKRKRKRKAAAATAAPASAAQPQPQQQQADTAETAVAPLRPREDKAVSVQVRDVRDLVSGGRVGSGSRGSSSSGSRDGPQPRSSSSPAAATATTFDAPSSDTNNVDDDDDDDDDNDEEDAFKRLLQDARELQALEAKGRSSNDGTKVGSLTAERGGGDDSSSSPSFSAPRAVQDALSAVVTADFFLICGLLLWFLTGIVASSLFKNDAVQIAFNNIFEPVVQPALGVLMLGSALSAVFKEEEGDADV